LGQTGTEEGTVSNCSDQQKGEPKARLVLRSSQLGGFVADRAPHSFRKVWWKFSHVMGGARMLGALLQDLLLSLSSCNEIAVHADVSTADHFRHFQSPSGLSSVLSRRNSTPDIFVGDEVRDLRTTGTLKDLVELVGIGPTASWLRTTRENPSQSERTLYMMPPPYA